MNMYCMREVKYDIIEIAKATKSMNVKYFPRKRIYRIKFKQNGRYMTGWETFNQIKFLYETTKMQKIDWNFFIYQVFSNYIEI